jgi:predicted DNA-binding transcriptional regulator AlpA
MLDIKDQETLSALATELWALMVGSHADPVEFNLRAKLALETRMLGCDRPPFGLDKLGAAETAAYIGGQVQTLHDKKKRRVLGIPEPYSVGRKLFWRRSELDEWIERQRPPKIEAKPPGRPRKVASHGVEAP